MKIPFKQRQPCVAKAPLEEVVRAIVVFLDLEFYMAVNLNDPDEAREDKERLHCRKRRD